MLNSSPHQKDNILNFIVLNTSDKSKERWKKMSHGHNSEACLVGEDGAKCVSVTTRYHFFC